MTGAFRGVVRASGLCAPAMASTAVRSDAIRTGGATAERVEPTGRPPALRPAARTGTAARVLAAAACALGATDAAAQSADELARQLANPVASLVSVPFQNNWDRRIGPLEAGARYTLNVQPVIPVPLGADWNLVTRMILPVVAQSDIAPGTGRDRGVGDAVVSVFLSPAAPTAGGWIWGAGPVMLVPTGSEDRLTADRWGLGPTAVALRQDGPWSYGALVNHIVSVGSGRGRPDVGVTLLNPFVTYSLGGGTSVTLQTEISRDWERGDTSAPVALIVGQVIKVGGQLMQVSAGPRWYAADFDNGPRGWGFRLGVSLLFPK